MPLSNIHSKKKKGGGEGGREERKTRCFTLKMTAVSHRKQQKPWKVVPQVQSFRNILIMQYANSKRQMRCLLFAGKKKKSGERKKKQGRHNPAKISRSEMPSHAP